MMTDLKVKYRFALDPLRCKGTGRNSRTAAKRLELGINNSTLFVDFYLKCNRLTNVISVSTDIFQAYLHSGPPPSFL